MKRTTILTLLIGLLFSCNPDIDFESVVPQHVDKFTTEFISDIRKGNIEKCLSQVTPEMNNQAGRDYLTNSHNSLRSLQIDSFRIINAGKHTLVGENGFTDYTVEYEYFIKGKYLYFSFVIHEEDDKLFITAFDSRVFDTSLAEINSLSLEEKTFVHYFFLLSAILTPVFILVTLIFAIWTKLNKKWLWIIGILLGFVKFSLNWTTGQVGFQILSFQILGAGLTRSGNIAPWTITFSLPLIGIYFWVKRYLDKKDSEMLTRFAEEVKNRKTKNGE